MKKIVFLTLYLAAMAALAATFCKTYNDTTAALTERHSARVVVIPTAHDTVDYEALSVQTVKPCYKMITTTVEPQQRKVRGRELTDDEKHILVKIAQAEAETEGLKGKALVMCVVLNRVECETEFKNDVKGVVFEKGQFSPVRTGCRYWTTTPDEECYEALEMVLSGWDESHGALYFEGHKTTDNWHWRNLEFLFKHGTHRFYK